MNFDYKNITMEELEDLFGDSDVKLPYLEVMSGLFDVCDLMTDTIELVNLIRKESTLKKHHRPYLHVRDVLEEKAEATMQRVSELYQNALMRVAKGFPEVSSCEDWEDYDRCKCSTVREEDYNCCPAAPETVPISKDKYDGMVEDLLTMADLIDMVCDMRTQDAKNIHELGKYVPAYAAFEKNRLSVYRNAAKEAEEIIDRWEDDLEEEDDEPDEYFSD